MRKTGGVAIVKVKRVTGVDVSREWVIDKLETGKKNRTKKKYKALYVFLREGHARQDGSAASGVAV